MKFMKGLTGMLTGVLLIMIFTGYGLADEGNRISAYTMFVEGHKVGVIRSAARGLAVYDGVVDSVTNQFDEDITIDGSVHFEQIQTNSNRITSELALASAINKKLDIKMYA